MGRKKINKVLKSYNNERIMLNKTVPYVNSLLDKVEQAFGTEVYEDTIYYNTYVYIHKTIKKIEFFNLSKDEMDTIKKALKIDKLEKDINEHGVKLHTTIKYIHESNPVEIKIVFEFKLPETCEIIKEYEYKLVDADKYKKTEEGLLKRTEKVVGVKCGNESIIDSLFGSEVN